MVMDASTKKQFFYSKPSQQFTNDSSFYTEFHKCRDSLDKSPFLQACGYGQLDVLEKLLQEGNDPYSKSLCGRTALHETCIGGHVPCLILLLELSPDLDAQDHDGFTAVHMAALHGEEDCLKCLASKGANLLLGDNYGRLPIHLAAMRNHLNIVQLLLSDGNASLGATCNLRKTPLHYAAQYGSVNCLKYIIEQGFEPLVLDGSGLNPAQCAARYDKLKCLRYLLKHGIQANCRNKNGQTLAHLAGYHGSTNVLHWLLAHTTVRAAAAAGDKTAAAVGPNIQDGSGNTVGHLAAKRGKAECFSCYLNYGGNLKITNAMNDTPMDLAKSSGHLGIMQKAVNKEITCPVCEKESQQGNSRRLSGDSSENLFPTQQIQRHRLSLPLPLPKGKTQLELYVQCQWNGEAVE
ncbi:repeat and kinase domain-containing 1-like [Octopus vulgaris]|nr:repeat and kinase domain-containing 1-like [Octopus vulgaris]